MITFFTIRLFTIYLFLFQDYLKDIMVYFQLIEIVFVFK
jgi:hypothetical protein